jgi:hypothetical protein
MRLCYFAKLLIKVLVIFFQIIECLEAVPIRQISCGGNHTVIVTMSGAVYAWGKNSRGQLGLGDTQVRGIGHECLVVILMLPSALFPAVDSFELICFKNHLPLLSVKLQLK